MLIANPVTSILNGIDVLPPEVSVTFIDPSRLFVVLKSDNRDIWDIAADATCKFVKPVEILTSTILSPGAEGIPPAPSLLNHTLNASLSVTENITKLSPEVILAAAGNVSTKERVVICSKAEEYVGDESVSDLAPI